jgi:hypothetical protein
VHEVASCPVSGSVPRIIHTAIPLNLSLSEIMRKRKGGGRVIVRTTLKAGGVLFAE